MGAGALEQETVSRILVAASHFALARTEAELQQLWLKAQAEFQAGWERRGRRLLFLIHDQYDMISDDDVVSVVGSLNELGKRHPIDLILHTRGGLASSSYQIAEAIVGRPNTTTFVPIFASSGGTIIALSTKQIVMGQGAALGPIDLQYNGRPIHDLIRIADELGDNAPAGLRLDAIDAKRWAKEQTKKACDAINRAHKGLLGWRGCELARKLTSGDIPHGQGISLKQARKLHIKARKGVPKSVYALLSARMEQLARLRELQRTKVEQTGEKSAAIEQRRV